MEYKEFWTRLSRIYYKLTDEELKQLCLFFDVSYNRTKEEFSHNRIEVREYKKFPIIDKRKYKKLIKSKLTYNIDKKIYLKSKLIKEEYSKRLTKLINSVDNSILNEVLYNGV